MGSRNCPRLSHTLSPARPSLSLSSGSRRLKQPATFWPAVLSFSHRSRRGRYQNDRAAVLFLPWLGPAANRPDFAGKSKRKARFRPKLRRLRSPLSGHRFRQMSVGNSIYELGFGRISRGDSGHFRSDFGVRPRTKVTPNRVLYLE
ncbi:unnamed protein product [Prunus armeniaca]